MNRTVRRKDPMRALSLLILALVSGLSRGAQDRPATDTFDAGAAAWELLPPGNWTVQDGTLVLTKPGPQRPPVRRPGAYALYRSAALANVTITLRVQSLRPAAVKGRDVCILFGYQDDTHFYYAHLSNDSNGQTHNVIVKVDGTQRRAMTSEKLPEPRLTDGWHDVRVEHHADGRIAVFMDDMATPLMTAADTAYPRGRVGFGAFDDPASFDDVTVSGSPVGAAP